LALITNHAIPNITVYFILEWFLTGGFLTAVVTKCNRVRSDAPTAGDSKVTLHDTEKEDEPTGYGKEKAHGTLWVPTDCGVGVINIRAGHYVHEYSFVLRILRSHSLFFIQEPRWPVTSMPAQATTHRRRFLL
jgi:hypothetical protein